MARVYLKRERRRRNETGKKETLIVVPAKVFISVIIDFTSIVHESTILVNGTHCCIRGELGQLCTVCTISTPFYRRSEHGCVGAGSSSIVLKTKQDRA